MMQKLFLIPKDLEKPKLLVEVLDSLVQVANFGILEWFSLKTGIPI